MMWSCSALCSSCSGVWDTMNSAKICITSVQDLWTTVDALWTCIQGMSRMSMTDTPMHAKDATTSHLAPHWPWNSRTCSCCMRIESMT